MKPLVILSHGLESGPEATKVSALAAVADELGFAAVRPDFRDLDASRDVSGIDDRIARLVAQAKPERAVVLAGSSMGSFASGFASQRMNCLALFLIALPIRIPGYSRDFQAREVPTALVHGWHDELCPVDETVAFARKRGDQITLLDDDHRLSAHVDFIARLFADFLRRFDPGA